MKKLLALLLCVLMVVSMLAACGNKDDDDDDDKKSTKATTSDTKGGDSGKTTKPAESQETGSSSQTQKPNTNIGNKQETTTGTILDAPEVTFDFNKHENVYIWATITSKTGTTQEMVLAVSGDLFYVSDGWLTGSEAVYELSDYGVVKYTKADQDYSFAKDVTTSQDELTAEVDEIAELLALFLDISSQMPGVKYKKTNEVAFSMVGDVYTYNLIENGVEAGKIHIHKETGIMSYFEDGQGVSMTINQLKLTDIPIPDYK